MMEKDLVFLVHSMPNIIKLFRSGKSMQKLATEFKSTHLVIEAIVRLYMSKDKDK